MTYENIVDDLILSIPEISQNDDPELRWLDGHPPFPYLVFGSLLIPLLEKALSEHNSSLIERICGFLEEVALSAIQDRRLEDLIRVEIGEWLRDVAFEERLARWLGPETKRLCRYVPGLATQRRELRMQQNLKGVRVRIRCLWRTLRG